MIINRQRAVRVSAPPLRRFLARVRGELRLRPHCLTVCLVDNPEMARLNHAYRGKRGPTDVLSFPAQDRASRRAAYLGDIAISPAVARRNARLYRRTLPDELRILILHGVLHLLGYDHETDNGRMDRRESRLRRRLGLVP
jgi:probable rRNA maturation factor